MRIFGFGSNFECQICGKTAKMIDDNGNTWCNRHKNLAFRKRPDICNCWKNFGSNGRHDVKNCDCKCHNEKTVEV